MEDNKSILVVRMKEVTSQTAKQLRAAFTDREVWVVGDNIEALYLIKEQPHTEIHTVFDLNDTYSYTTTGLQTLDIAGNKSQPVSGQTSIFDFLS